MPLKRKAFNKPSSSCRNMQFVVIDVGVPVTLVLVTDKHSLFETK